MIKRIKWLYRKWIKRECPHLCVLCKYKIPCREDLKNS